MSSLTLKAYADAVRRYGHLCAVPEQAVMGIKSQVLIAQKFRFRILQAQHSNGPVPDSSRNPSPLAPVLVGPREQVLQRPSL